MIPAVPAPLVTHLLQSTVFAGLVWLAALALRRHDARARYWLWVAASMKFLVPFASLVAVGSQIHWRTAPASVRPAASFVVEQVLGGPAVAVAAPADLPSTTTLLPTIALGIWVAGCAIVLLSWWRQWIRIRSAVREARPQEFDARYDTRGLTVMSSVTAMEPGIVGVWRPVLIVPHQLREHLTPAQMNAVFAHELNHLRCRDNLVAAFHMIVEAMFWFHPLTWWIGSRLIEERERACDEGVLRSGHEAHAYAEGILTVCRLTVRTPLACVSGVSGANLRQRIESIMARTRSRELRPVHKAAFIVAAATVVAGPLLASVLAAPARLQAEQAVARVQFDAASIKRASPDSFEARGGGATFQALPAGRLHVVNNEVKNLIGNAYDIPQNRIVGGPDWIAADHYDVEATAGRESSRPEMMRMLQALLEERFGLKVHREMRQGQVYILKVPNGGPRLERSRDDGCEPDDPRRTGPSPSGKPTCGNNHITSRGGIVIWKATHISMQSAAGALGALLRSPVFDQTGLEGSYDIDIELPGLQPTTAAGGPDASAADSPSLFTVLREKLGLTLERGKAPLEMLVIDRIERPTEN